MAWLCLRLILSQLISDSNFCSPKITTTKAYLLLQTQTRAEISRTSSYLSKLDFTDVLEQQLSEVPPWGCSHKGLIVLHLFLALSVNVMFPQVGFRYLQISRNGSETQLSYAPSAYTFNLLLMAEPECFFMDWSQLAAAYFVERLCKDKLWDISEIMERKQWHCLHKLWEVTLVRSFSFMSVKWPLVVSGALMTHYTNSFVWQCIYESYTDCYCISVESVNSLCHVLFCCDSGERAAYL